MRLHSRQSSSRSPIVVPLFVLFGLLAVSPSLFASQTRELSLRFTSTRQSMWGPGDTAPPLKQRFTIFDIGDDKSASFDAMFTIDTFFWGDVKIGADGRVRAGAHLGMFADISIPEFGSVDVTYPVNSRLTFPDENSFRAGDTIAIGSSYTVPNSEFSLVTRSPKAEFELKGKFGMNLELFAEACVVACIDTRQIGIPHPIINVPVTEFTIFRLASNSSYTPPPQVGLFSPVTLEELHVPNIDTTGTQSGLRLISSGHDDFLKINVDVSGLAEAALGIPIPLRFDTDDYGFPELAGVRFAYTIFGADYKPSLRATQDFAFEATPKVVFTFPEPLKYSINSGSEQPAAATVEMKVGDTLHLVTPASKQPTPVSPSFRLDNKFSSDTSFAFAHQFDLEAGALVIQIPNLTIIPELCIPGFCIDFGWFGEACFPELCIPEVSYNPPDFDLGPVWEDSFEFPTVHLGTLFNGNWQMEGFPVLSDTTPLSIDPENPIISIQQRTGATRNLGSGKRLVSFVVDLGNPGDVTLSKLSLKNALANAFLNARSVTLDHLLTCGLDLDPAFNGGTSMELLAIGNTLSVSGKKRVVVYAVVSPGADPDPFTNQSDTEGRSPLDTLVSGNANSSFLLGQGNPQGAADFALFGEHFVKFDSAADVFGHVGSNDLIEVKNGRTGIVAGDLRAGKSMKVSGEISADYALSGGVVDVVGKGRLTLFGNMKQFQAITPFTLSAPAWQPATPLAGDVWVPANGAASIDPGNYGYVTVNSGGQLTLRPGTYSISRLQVKPGSRVEFGGAVNVIVGHDLQLGAGAVLSGGGSSRDAVINVLQSGEITLGSGSSLRGVIIAPRANLMFGASSRLEGSAYARSITLNPGVSVRYHVDCDPLIDPNCDGTPDCP